MKKCSKCKEQKDISQFTKDKGTKDGLLCYCKSCTKIIRACKAKYNTEYQKAYKDTNKQKVKKYNAKYRAANKDKLDEQKRQYYLDNQDRLIDKQKKYQLKNRDRISKYWKNKRKTDINFKIAHSLRSRINSIISKGTRKGSAVRDLGCSIEEFKIYIEQLFVPGMTWVNHGKWHFDHIKPLSSFNLSNRNQFLEACNYRNIQPLWAKENLKKGKKDLTRGQKKV